MKRLLSIIIAIMMFLISAITNATGDVTRDGKIDSRDIALIQKHIIYSVSLDNIQMKAADFNGDGCINSRDIARMQLKLLDLVSEPESNPTEPSTFSIHFIDVGQADAALVECDGHYMLIDGGNSGDSSLIFSVLKNEKVPVLDILVASHAHEDHVGGLSGALNYTTAKLTLCPVKSYDSDVFNDFSKYADKNGGGITVPKAGAEYMLGSAKLTILGLNLADDTNNTSIVLKITYGNTSFLFTGDAEREAEQALLDNGVDLSATVLKVGHHGADTSTTYPFLREIMPEYAVISVGEGNSYDHPTEATLSKLEDANVKLYRTDMQGNIYCTSDGDTVSFTVEKNKDADVYSKITPTLKPTAAPTPETTSPASNARDYVLNNSTKKFHYPSCSSAAKIKEENKGYFEGTREELINDGYSPCGICKP